MKLVVIEPQTAVPFDFARAVEGTGIELVPQPFGPGGEIPEATYRLADGIVQFRIYHRFTEAVIAKLERCRLIVQASVGFNHIDLEAAARAGIPVCNTPDYGTTEVADHAVALMLGLARGIVAYNDRLRRSDGGWGAINLKTPRRLRGATFAVLGLGRIGLAAAQRARAFGMDVVFHDPYQPNGYELATGFRRARTLDELLGQADVLSLHAPLTAETRHIIDAAALARMKPTALLVNTARGELLDMDALHAALREGRLAGAGLDVLEVEPIDRSHPLLAAWSAEEPWLEGRLIVTPHAAFYSPASLADMRRLALETAVDYLARGTLRNCVNGHLLNGARR